MGNGRSVILLRAYPGQLTCSELERLAANGERPRKDYVELARALDADVIDWDYMRTRAMPLARAISARAGFPSGQIVEVFLRQGRYQRICAWGELYGLPLALLFKLTRGRRDLAMTSVWLSRPKKAVFLRYLKVQSHVAAIVNYGSVQMEMAATRLGVPREKLHLVLQPVDERFWQPEGVPTENVICAVGQEARDYPTLIRAVRGLDLRVDLAIGTAAADALARGAGAGKRPAQELSAESLPSTVSALSNIGPRQVRRLYSRSRFVVLPIHNVEFDAGVTALVEAMAMGKAVIISRTRGQADILSDGVHGIYVPPGDPRALRAAIEHLLTHPEEADRMGQAGRALVEQRHTLDAYVARLAAIVRTGDHGG